MICADVNVLSRLQWSSGGACHDPAAICCIEDSFRLSSVRLQALPCTLLMEGGSEGRPGCDSGPRTVRSSNQDRWTCRRLYRN